MPNYQNQITKDSSLVTEGPFLQSFSKQKFPEMDLGTNPLTKETFVMFSNYYCCCLVAKSVRLFLKTPWTVALPGSSVHGISGARILEWGGIPFSRIFPTQGSNPRLLHFLYWQEDSLPLVDLFLSYC